MLSRPLMQRCEADFFFLLTGFASFPSFFTLCPPRHAAPSPAPPPSPQLNLIHSEVSNLAGFDVEGVINPTTAELELKDDLGETPPKSTRITAGSLEKKILECFSSSMGSQTSHFA